MYTPTSPTQSSTGGLVPARRLLSPAPGCNLRGPLASALRHWLARRSSGLEWGTRFEARFVLRCVQVLSLETWLPGTVPCRTTGTLEVSAQCSSRTDRTLLSVPLQSR
jgi:hypothetical protein